MPTAAKTKTFTVTFTYTLLVEETSAKKAKEVATQAFEWNSQEWLPEVSVNEINQTIPKLS